MKSDLQRRNIRQDEANPPMKKKTKSCICLWDPHNRLLYMEFCDTIKEGDGHQILRCWRYFIMLFNETKRTNYSSEAFTLLAQYHFLRSPRAAMQHIWNRTINVHGCAGKNISCDLHMVLDCIKLFWVMVVTRFLYSLHCYLIDNNLLG